MASIQKRVNSKGTSYRVFIRRRGIRPITKVLATKKLALEFVLKMESDRRLQQYYGGRSNTLSFIELVESYMLNEYKGSRPKEQESKLRYWVNILNSQPIVEISTDDIRRGLTSLPAELANATINRYKAIVSVVFGYACNQFDLPTNPVQGVRSLLENNARIRYLSNEERTRLFEACRASSWSKLHLLVLMAITTGARKGELMKLGWSDIDFDRQAAFVETSKNGEPKVLPLTDSVIKELQLFNTTDNGLIFASTVKPDKPYCFTKPWYKALKDADIQDFRFHDLRHSCASYLAMNGASLLEIADVLGHKQIQMTKRYAHLCIEHKSSLINRVMGGI